MLKGIAASSGYAVKKVFKLVHPELIIEKRVATVEDELAKFLNARENSKKDISVIKSKAVGKLTDEDLAIFDAHLMVIDDPEFISQVETMIKDEAVNAEFAVDVIGNNFIAIFESMEDEYFKARAADIKDVTYRVKTHLLGIKVVDLSLIDEEVVIVAEDLTPSDTAQLDKQYVKGFITEIGGRTSHSAIMARSLEIPAVVGCKSILSSVNEGDLVILDGVNGQVYINPNEELQNEYLLKVVEMDKYKESLKTLLTEESVSLDGKHVEIAGNIGTPRDVDAVIANGGDGVGLYRTEFLYMDSSSLPTEQQQFEAYKEVLEKMSPKPVVVRTLDIGGDKELPYLPLPHEMNPFLGYRAIRLCLDRQDIFITQLRALLRASVYGKLRIMFPMIATLDEFRRAKAVYEKAKVELDAEGIKYSNDIEVGMMVEIPAAAVLADQFAKEVDFFSIGTNDLIQYSMAADRMSEPVSYLYQPFNPSILRLIKMTIDGAHKYGKWCGMCGEMAGDALSVPVLLGLGLDEFSMSASSILEARKMVRSLDSKEMEKLSLEVIDCNTDEEVISKIKKYINKEH